MKLVDIMYCFDDDGYVGHMKANGRFSPDDGNEKILAFECTPKLSGYDLVKCLNSSDVDDYRWRAYVSCERVLFDKTTMKMARHW